MEQKEHALAKFYKTKSIGSRKTWSVKFQVDVKEEGERGSDLNVQWTLSGELLNMSTVPYFGYENKNSRTASTLVYEVCDSLFFPPNEKESKKKTFYRA